MPVMTDANAIRIEDATDNTREDKPKRDSIAELKNGKPILKQKPLAFEKMSETMQEIVRFRELLEEKIERRDTPLDAFPDDHRPLVAKMVHESDKTLQALAKHIQHELLPAQDEDDEEANKTVLAALPLEVVEKVIKSLATRTNYGLDGSHAPNGRIPASWQIWRWEVKEEFRGWLPKASREKIIARLAERQQAKLDIVVLFNSLPEAEREALVGAKSTAGKGSSTGKSKAKSSNGESSTTKKEPVDASVLSPKVKKTAAENESSKKDAKDGTPSKSAGAAKPKKAVDPEKAAKEKEREEKRQAKLEKEKKAQDAQSKSRNLMANFFGKPKAPVASGSGSRSGSVTNEGTEEHERKPTQDANTPSEFDRVFKPFVLKKDAEIASGNWFNDMRRRQEEAREVIVVDDEEPSREIAAINLEPDEDVIMLDSSDGAVHTQSTSKDRLRESLSSLPPSLRPPQLPYPPRRHPTLRTYHSQTVRATMQDLTEAEVSGDVPTVRNLVSRLRNRSIFPAKVLIFHEDARPGYFGTWTRNSREVGPRTPFSRDVVSLDYGVDSGEEWEEEEEGDVLENDDEEEGAATDEHDSDLDSWLVDDDEVEDPGTPIDDRIGSPDFFPPPLPKRKAKEAGEAEGTKEKKRKVVVPLVPFTKGPCWESQIGECTYEPFNAYRIHMFNDTPFPIDPFTFQSESIADLPTHKAATTTTHSGFAVPPLPSRLGNPSTALSTPSSHAPVGPKKPVPPPKTSFPDSHMPFLIQKIAELDTGNMAFIVESVYKDLTHQTKNAGAPAVKKNAIEAKVKEVTEKEKRIWTVKAEVKALYGTA